MKRLLVPDVAAGFAEHAKVSQKNVNQILQSLRGDEEERQELLLSSNKSSGLVLSQFKKIKKKRLKREGSTFRLTELILISREVQVW